MAPPPAASPPAATPVATPVATGQRTPLGQMLVTKGMVTAAQLAEALLQQPTSGTRLGTLMVGLGGPGALCPPRP